MSLTGKQRRLKKDIEDISSLFGLDHWNILQYEERYRTFTLQKIKNQLIRSEIIMRYALIDEFLANIICHQFFKRPQTGSHYGHLWRTKKFSAFVHHLLDGVYLLGKLRMVHDLKALPREIRDNIERINALRNAVAHSLFPENRYQHREHGKVVYRDHDISTPQGLTQFYQESQSTIEYLYKRAYGRLLP
jgi:hypothetical protein